jgi:AraC-like DNA-binding protein
MATRLSIEATCDLIDALLAHGYPALEEVARLLRVSSRTFQRQLNREGISYSDLVERCRCKAACEALEHTERPIQDISATLGYADASSFARAFRRWTGLSPRAYRNQSPGQQANRFNPLARNNGRGARQCGAKWSV